MRVATDITVSSVKFGCSRMFTYEDCVHWRCVTAADEVEYDLQILYVVTDVCTSARRAVRTVVSS